MVSLQQEKMRRSKEGEGRKKKRVKGRKEKGRGNNLQVEKIS
jgi:hypothetical protein